MGIAATLLGPEIRRLWRNWCAAGSSGSFTESER
jgi:hypothetical protein